MSGDLPRKTLQALRRSIGREATLARSHLIDELLKIQTPPPPPTPGRRYAPDVDDPPGDVPPAATQS